MIIILKETRGDLRAPLCGHNVRALSIISPTSEDQRGRVWSPRFLTCLYFLWGQREGDPLNQKKKGRRRKSEKRNFQPEWFFQIKSKGPKHNGVLFFALAVCCGGWLGVGYLFKECPAVDVFGICGPCPSIVRSPQWLPLSWRWALPVPRSPACNFFFFLFSFSWFSRGVKSEAEIMSDSSPPTCPHGSFSLSLSLSRFTSVCWPLAPEAVNTVAEHCC